MQQVNIHKTLAYQAEMIAGKGEKQDIYSLLRIVWEHWSLLRLRDTLAKTT